MYLTLGRVTVAIDAPTCREKWSYTWQPKGNELSTMNRGVAIKDGKLVRGTADGWLIALDLGSGQLLWSRQIASAKSSEYLRTIAAPTCGACGPNSGGTWRTGAVPTSAQRRKWRTREGRNARPGGMLIWILNSRAFFVDSCRQLMCERQRCACRLAQASQRGRPTGVQWSRGTPMPRCRSVWSLPW